MEALCSFIVCFVVLCKPSVSVFVQGPLIVTEELHSLSFESELQLSQSGLDVKLEVRNWHERRFYTPTARCVVGDDPVIQPTVFLSWEMFPLDFLMLAC